MCLEGGLNCADLSGFICSDEQVTLRDTSCGIYNLQVSRGFMGGCHNLMTMQWIVVWFFYSVALEINCSLLFFFLIHGVIQLSETFG